MLVSDHLWVGPSMPNSAIGLVRGPILGAVRAMRGYVAKNDSDTVPLDDSPSGYGRTSRFACAPRGMCADYDEIELARWLLDRGMNVYEQAAIDSDGFGGQTPLFATVVSQPNFWMNHRGQVADAPFTRLLLDHGANPDARASLRKRLHPGYGIDGMHEYRNVTPISWGEQFHFKSS
jgi:hypothetical protein